MTYIELTFKDRAYLINIDKIISLDYYKCDIGILYENVNDTQVYGFPDQQTCIDSYNKIYKALMNLNNGDG